MSDLAFIIQGPTTFCEEIVNCYDKFENVVWSTWDDEPIANLNFIKSSNIKLIISKKPNIPGFMNANLQAYSVIEGIKYFENISNIKYIVKIRSDFIITPFSKFINEIKCHILSKYFIGIIFVGYCNYQKSKYFLDYVVVGSKIELTSYFQPVQSNELDYGLPFPELFFQNRYSNKLEVNLFDNKLTILKTNGIKLYWIKHNVDIKKMSFKLYFRSISFPFIWINNVVRYYSAKCICAFNKNQLWK